MRRPARTLVIGAVVIVATLGLLVYQALSSNLVYYITPSELHAKGTAAYGQSLRLGGQVRPGSVHWDAKKLSLTFTLQDPKNSVLVSSRGTPPALFRDGAGVVVEGIDQHNFFLATNLMIKHGSDYRAPKPGDTPVPDSQYSSK